MTEKEMELAVTNYMHWYGVATFLRCPLVTDFKNVDIGLVGVPYSGGNAIERMQYLGPRAVRNRSSSYHRAHRQFGFDPFKIARVADLGDAPVGRTLNPDMAAEDFQAFYEQVFAANIRPVSVGGDHSITWPILRAARKVSFPEPVGMIHFDSHTDAQPAVPATRNHAGGFMMGAQDGIIDPKRTVQIGMRGPVALLEQDDWAKENFARVITTEEVVTQGVPHVIDEVRRIIGDGPVYLSFDLDAIDPAYAPAVADPETDGLTIREVNQLLRGFRGLNFLGADIVCFCPPMDTPGQLTAMTSAAMLHDMVSLIADRHFSKRG